MADVPGRTWPAIDVALRPPLTPATAEFPDTLALVLDGMDAVAVEEHPDGAWRVFFEHTQSRDACLAVLRAQFQGVAAIDSVEVEDEGWAVKVQASLGSIRAGRFVVTPPWESPATSPGDIVIVIEPSMGFGTGHHQSTRLCLAALERLPLAGRRVVDAGTGSGVLAIAAARLGATEVLALDHDPDAVRAAAANVAANDVAAVVTCGVASLADGPAAPSDVVLANLTVLLLRRFAGAVAGSVRPGGTLVTSGFTIDQVPLVLDAYADFVLAARDEEDDWVSLTLRRTN